MDERTAVKNIILAAMCVLLIACTPPPPKRYSNIKVSVIGSGYSSGWNGYDLYIIATSKGMFLSRVDVPKGCYIISYVDGVQDNAVTGALLSIQKDECAEEIL